MAGRSDYPNVNDILWNKINVGAYPHVARMSDPLIFRFEKLSLLVGNTNFYVKIKFGIGWKGFSLYCSGSSIPVYEEEFAKETTAEKYIESQAKLYLDKLELELANQVSDNAIKRSIDRLCWQLHYDITESHTNFVDVFGQDDFSDVQIDRYPMDTEYWDGITLTTAISDSAGVTYKKDYGVGSCTVTIEDKGYLKDFDDHLTTGTYRTGVVGDKTVVTKGSLMTVFDEHLLGGMYSDSNPNIGAIKTFDDHLLKNSYDDGGNGAFKKFNDALNDENSGSLIKIGKKLVPDDVGNKKYYSISECLRDEKDGGTEQAYSVAKSLREIGQTSVSQATHDQTELEENKFTEISDTKLGDFGSSGHRTLCDTLGDYVDSTKQSLSLAVGYSAGNISVEGALGVTTGGDTTSVADRIGKTSGASIADRIGVFNVGGYRSLFDTISGPNGYAKTSKHSLSDAVGYLTGVGLEEKLNDIKSVIGDKNDVGVNETISGRVHTMYTNMQGENGVSGFVRYGTWNGETSWYVRATT